MNVVAQELPPSYLLDGFRVFLANVFRCVTIQRWWEGLQGEQSGRITFGNILSVTKLDSFLKSCGYRWFVYSDMMYGR